MKKYKVSLRVVFILLAVVILSIGLGVARYISLIQMRYDVLLGNTMMITDNITNTFTSLESDKIVQRLSRKLGVLKRENANLRAQLRKSERQLNNLSKIEKRCQARLNALTERDYGNRGFLIKDGKNTSP